MAASSRRAARRRPLQRHVPAALRRARARPAPPAARAAAAQRARRPARGAAAARARADRRARAARARRRRRPRADRRAVLRHGARRGRRRSRRASRAALDTPHERRRIGEQLVDALVEVHAVDWRACGLEGFSTRPESYLARQLRRFGGLWEHNRTREIAAVERVGAWLAEHVPASPAPTIVHGDYRLGNVMLAPGRAGARRGGVRLGDGDDRRSARRRRLPQRDVDRRPTTRRWACSSSRA